MESSIAVSTAFAAMIIIGLIIAVVVVKVCNTNGKFKTNYDERQQIMIGKSYKCAMITAWILLAIYIVIDAGGNKLPMDNSMVAFTIMFISVMVFASYSVWTDAYFGSNNNYKRFAIMAVVVTVINASAAITEYRDGRLIVDGVLTFRGISAECALMFLILGAEFLIKGIVDKKGSKEEDDDEES